MKKTKNNTRQKEELDLWQIDQFCKKLLANIDKLEIAEVSIEPIQRQLRTWEWVLKMKKILAEYSLEIEMMHQGFLNNVPSILGGVTFFDLPRPPVLYTRGDISYQLALLIKDVKSSPQYCEEIRIELDIDLLEAKLCQSV